MKSKKWETLHSAKRQTYETPDALYTTCSELYGPFDLDAAASKANTKCKNFLDRDSDALQNAWHLLGKKVWLNPPYKNVYAWVDKAYRESQMGCRVVCLLPSRTGTRWFQEFAMKASQLIFLPGRVKFKGQTNSAPFDSLLLVFD